MESSSDDRNRWKEACRRGGICMSCATGSPEPFGCTDCLNTGWEGGSPAGYVAEATHSATAAERDRLAARVETLETSLGTAVVAAVELRNQLTTERARNAEMLAALKLAENFIANTEGELGIELDSGIAARAAIARAQSSSAEAK